MRTEQFEQRTAFTFLAVYRGFSLVVAAALIFSSRLFRSLTLPETILMGAVCLYTLFKLVHPLYQYRRNIFTYGDFVIDLLLALLVLYVTGGLHSPFMLYSLSPLLTSAVMMPRRFTFPVAGLPAIAAVLGEVFVSGNALGTVFNIHGPYFGLLSAFTIGSLLLGVLPYIMNINAYQDIKTQAIVEERKHISQNVHDGVAQSLGIIRWRLEVLKGKVNAGNSAAALADIAQIKTAVEIAQGEARQLIEQLRTTLGDSRGFVATLRHYSDIFSQNYGIKCELHLDGKNADLSPLAELQLLYVIQEALNNIRKHATASVVDITFRSGESGTELIIRDNGSGFDPKKVYGGYGLAIMAERVKSINGEFKLDSSPGRGTEIRVTLGSKPKLWLVTHLLKGRHSND